MEVQNPYRIELFFEKVNKNGPLFRPTSLYPETNLGRCWVWTGAKDKKKYGNFTVAKGKTAKAHRFSFLLHFGWILPGPHYQIEHKCKNTSCVNPRHLILLPGKVNLERSDCPSAINKRKTHCKRGHEFSKENTFLRRGSRICITCEKERGRIC